MLALQVSGSDHKPDAPGAEDGVALTRDGRRQVMGSRSAPAFSAHGLVELWATLAAPEARCPLFDETERRRLMSDVVRLVRDPRLPEATRVAGLALVGWLARRRIDELPHAVGVAEARQAEQRVRAKLR
jgi:hypothetical protein